MCCQSIQHGDQQGFTLIELMIVIGIIGILSAVAIPSYNDYINTSKQAVVSDNFEELVDFMNVSYSAENTRQALGITGNGEDLPTSQADLVDYINDNIDAQTPEGAIAYGDASDDLSGAIGVQLTMAGSAWRNGDSVTITMPGYKDLTTRSVTVTYR